jgi:hypothetical protein
MSKKVTEQLDIEETARYVNLGIPILVYAINGKKIYYKLRTLTIEESKHISTSEHELTHTLIPLTSAELKEIGIEESAAQELQGQEVDIEESTAEPILEEKKTNLTLSGDKDAVRAARKILESNMGSAKPVMNEKEQELEDENEDLKNKLGLISQIQYEKKQKEATDKVNKLIADPEKRAIFIEQIKSGKPDQVSALDKTMDLLADQLKTNSNQRFETPAGNAPLNSQQWGNQNNDNIWTRKFPSGEAMAKSLEAYAQDPNNSPAEQGRAKAVIGELWQKNVREWKANNKTGQLISNRDEGIPQKNGNVEVKEEELGGQLDSELKRIVGGSFKPAIHGYSKTHSPSRIVTQGKGD